MQNLPFILYFMIRIVVVEDEKLVLWGIRSLFEEQNTYFLSASFTNAEEALTFMQHDPPDVLITDIKMPKMDGLTLIKEIKHVYPELHVIVLSFFDDFKLVHEAFRLGIDDYILKHELDSENLFSVLNTITSGSSENNRTLSFASA